MEYDVLVVGGGIQGVGVAQAAAAAGYSVLLLEQDELASATSSRSSKLIHGGLRYLESAQFGLVYESLHERETLLKIAPDLVHLTPFYIPVYKTTSRDRWQIRAGLSLYSILGGLSNATRFRSVPRKEWQKMEGLKTEGLKGVYQYWDAQTDDAALTRAVMKSAERLGAEWITGARLISAEKNAIGFEVNYLYRDNKKKLQCRALVNAAGPWVNKVLQTVVPTQSQLPVDLVQGTHIVLEGLVNKNIYYLEAPQDRRAVFVMPWKEDTLVGTTEKTYHGDPAAVSASQGEIEYLSDIVKHYFPFYRGALLESFAGLRVLPGGSNPVFHRKRETILQVDDQQVPRLITLYGGKLTGYRATAEKVINKLAKGLPVRHRVEYTHLLKL